MEFPPSYPLLPRNQLAVWHRRGDGRLPRGCSECERHMAFLFSPSGTGGVTSPKPPGKMQRGFAIGATKFTKAVHDQIF